MSLSTGNSYATQCESIPLKPIRHICGVVTDMSGATVPKTNLTLLKDGAEVANTQSGPDGKFDFKRLEAGTYELIAQNEGYDILQSPIVVVKPTAKCKRQLQVVLFIGSPCGGGISLMPRWYQK